MSSPGAAPTPPPPVRFADILFVDGVLDPGGQNPKHRRVVILTPNDALAAGFPIVAAPVTSQIPPVLGPTTMSSCPSGTRRAPAIPPPA